MSNKPNIHDILENACEKFGLTMGEAMAIIKTPLHPRELRDEFAGRAAEYLAWNLGNTELCAKRCYEIADALLKARTE